MKPIRNQIFAEIQEPKPTKSGLILLESNLEKYQAKVLAIGPKVEYIKVGDIVRYDRNNCRPYEHEGKKCVFFKEEGGVFVV